MGKSLSAFAKSMRQRAERLPHIASDVAKAGSIAIIRDWIQVIPVDTSEALSNTRIGLGGPPTGTFPAFFVGKKGSTRGASAERVIQEAITALAAKQPGQDIFVSNTARHIGELDRGSSIQFAGGFSARALIAFRIGAEEAKKSIWK